MAGQPEEELNNTCVGSSLESFLKEEGLFSQPCQVKGGPLVRCATCNQLKSPWGRDGGYYGPPCDWDCEGYELEPRPDTLWPGEVCGEAFPICWHRKKR